MVRLFAGLSLLAAALAHPARAGDATETAVLSGGCFWGVEAMFEHVKRVTQRDRRGPDIGSYR